MTRIPLSLLVLGAALAAGCAQPGVTPAAEPTVTATARLSIADAGGRRLLTLPAVEPWVKSDIDHAELTLYLMPTKRRLAAVTLQAADLDKAVKFNDLSIQATYLVEARAWADASGLVAIDNLENQASSCTTVFSTGTDDTLDIGVLKLRLVDKLFDGAATGAFAVTDGAVVDTTATPGILVTVE